MELPKKKRGENWSSEDKEILRQLISNSAHIIEDKSTKTSINIQKTKEWKNITTTFNTLTGRSRSDGELKLAWKRMKLLAKSNLSAHRMQQAKTGGGEKPPSPSPEDLQIMSIAPHDFVNEVNDYDSDALMLTTKLEQILPDVKPGPTWETAPITLTGENEEQIIVEVNAASNNPTTETESNEGIIITNNTVNTKKHTQKRKKSLQISSEEIRQSIAQSNADFKKKQLEMMQEEHKYNIEIIKLKIKKIKLEIGILESKKNNSSGQ